PSVHDFSGELALAIEKAGDEVVGSTSGPAREPRQEVGRRQVLIGGLAALATAAATVIARPALAPLTQVLAASQQTVTTAFPPDASRRVALLRGHTDQIEAVAWSPDGTLLASASDDRMVRLWEPAAEASHGGPLAGHSDFVLSVAWSPSSQRLASASA